MRASKSGMILGKRREMGWVMVLWFACFACAVRAQAPDDATTNTRDTLVYKDGDRVHGRLVERTGDVIVFKSDRFGELRVPASDAVVINAEKAPEPVVKHVEAAGIKPQTPTAQRTEEERVSIWERFSPAVLTAKVREFFGPWHGRVAISNEIVTDNSHRDHIAFDGRLTRKFTKDTVEMSARYDYDETNGATTTDVFKSANSWRHEFNRIQFTQYRPTIEWNRASRRQGILNEYVLLQQEIGFGLNLWTTPARKIRVGASENLFDIWNSPPLAAHSSRAVESLFEEMELTLPWRMTLVERGIWYPVARQRDGWENQLELNKKLTETLSIAIRHEIRRNNPDGASQDYTRLKFLFGLDF